MGRSGAREPAGKLKQRCLGQEKVMGAEQGTGSGLERTG